MSDSFYREFEDRYRGSRDLIISRLKVYLPFVLPLQGLYSQSSIVDLGCGRGEWLELMQSAGFDARGVDLDEEMLAGCRQLGLNVESGDAIAFLKKLPNESQLVVSGFHIVEHICFSNLQLLVQEALRVLKPGGLLILETPNPENIVVGTASFYLDPTHQRPIPSQLLAFLPEYYGYKKVNVLRLQEPESVNDKHTNLLTVLEGVSPDYAIVAQKMANADVLERNAEFFERRYGVTLEMLASEYDRKMLSKIGEIEARVQQVERVLDTIRNSILWRLTAPLRRIVSVVKKLGRPSQL